MLVSPQRSCLCFSLSPPKLKPKTHQLLKILSPRLHPRTKNQRSLRPSKHPLQPSRKPLRQRQLLHRLPSRRQRLLLHHLHHLFRLLRHPPQLKSQNLRPSQRRSQSHLRLPLPLLPLLPFLSLSSPLLPARKSHRNPFSSPLRSSSRRCRLLRCFSSSRTWRRR